MSPLIRTNNSCVVIIGVGKTVITITVLEMSHFQTTLSEVVVFGAYKSIGVECSPSRPENSRAKPCGSFLDQAIRALTSDP